MIKNDLFRSNYKLIKILKADGYDVKEPSFDFEENAGIDFYVPNYNETFEKDFKKYNPTKSIDKKSNTDYIIRIAPNENVIIPSGWYTKFNNNMALIACNKSGVSNKQHLSFTAHIIDSSYQGIFLMSVFNYGNDWTTIRLGDKLIQLLQVPILKGVIVENMSKDKFFQTKTKRGEGALGSTGLN